MRNIYLDRYAYPHTLIPTHPSDDLALIITIPCYNETSLVPCLESLYNCQIPDDIAVEVIVIINEPKNALSAISECNANCYSEAVNWVANRQTSQLSFKLLYEKLPKKHAGVGLARKMIMDEAVKRFESIDKDGIILCYDADCNCDPNYINEVYEYFQQNHLCPGASIYFEHPLHGTHSPEVYSAIVEYELFLRYYVNGLRFAGFPYAYETIGSSMAVRSRAYQKQGGMNRRKAGEDFYFLHKIIPMGNFGEINTTRVIPSPRPSDRVPFGTGKAVNQWFQDKSLQTYDLAIFGNLKSFLNNIEEWYHLPFKTITANLPESISAFLATQDFSSALDRIKNNTSSKETFIKQFYSWFDGFKALKYIHYARDNYYPNIPVKDAAHTLLSSLNQSQPKNLSAKELLIVYRERDRGY